MNNSKKIFINIIAIVIAFIAGGIIMPIIVKGDNNTAQKAQVLSGKTFSTGSAVAIVGQMQNFKGQIPEITATAADEDYIATIDLDDGYYESVKINAKPIYDRGVSAGATTHTGTYTFAANDTGSTKDLGVNHSYRYVNATNVYNKGKADGASGKNTLSVANVTSNSWVGGNNVNVSFSATSGYIYAVAFGGCTGDNSTTITVTGGTLLGVYTNKTTDWENHGESKAGVLLGIVKATSTSVSCRANKVWPHKGAGVVMRVAV